MYKRTSLIITD